MHRAVGNVMTIGQLAKSVGVRATTLRYYERERLLTPPERTAAGYRLYDQQALERVRFIRAAQGVGFTLEDIKTLLRLDGGESCAEVQKLLERRIGEVDCRMDELKLVRAALGKALNQCRNSNKACPVLTDLSARSRGRRNGRSN